jgi:hypothetical protein
MSRKILRAEGPRRDSATATEDAYERMREDALAVLYELQDRM